MDLLLVVPGRFSLHFSQQAAGAFRENFRPWEPQPSILNTYLFSIPAMLEWIKIVYLLGIYCFSIQYLLSVSLQYSCLENPMNSMKRQKDRTLKDEFPRSVASMYLHLQWRNNSRKNEEMEEKQKKHPVVDVTGDGSKVRCCKEQYCIGTWNVRSVNRQIGSGQTGDGKSECRHFRNQRTKMDWNGWI